MTEGRGEVIGWSRLRARAGKRPLVGALAAARGAVRAQVTVA